MHVGVTDARESQDARASRCSDASIQNETHASNVPFRFAIKISYASSLSRCVHPVGKILSTEDGREGRMAGSARSALYDRLHSRDREVMRARMQMVDADPGQILARKNSPWPWATLSTYYDTSKPGCGTFLGFDVRSVRVAAAPSIYGSTTSYEATRYEL